MLNATRLGVQGPNSSGRTCVSSAWSSGVKPLEESVPRCLRALLCVVCRLFINQIYCYICSAHANEVAPGARDTALISFPASVGCSPGRGMEITRQCCIKAKIKESMSNWSVTAVCPASQLDAEGFFFFLFSFFLPPASGSGGDQNHGPPLSFPLHIFWSVTFFESR